MENENAEIASDLQRVSQQKQDLERKAKNFETQLNEANIVRATQDGSLEKLESTCSKLQHECDTLNQQIEEVESKAGNLEVRLNTAPDTSHVWRYTVLVGNLLL